MASNVTPADTTAPPSGATSGVSSEAEIQSSPESKPTKKGKTVADAITSGKTLRAQKIIPKRLARQVPTPAVPRGLVPTDRDVKMSRRAMRLQARCLRKHNIVLSDRLSELAKPTRRQLISLWRTYAYILTPEQLYNLQNMLDASDPFKPEEAYQYFLNLKKQKRRSEDKEKGGKDDKKKKLSELCGDRRFAWACSATVAFACGIQQRLGRPGRYDLEDGMLRLSDIVLGEICSYSKMKPPCRRSRNPKAKFMIEMADKIAVWIDEILAESDERMLMMDFDEDEVVEHADEPVLDAFLNMMAGKGGKFGKGGLPAYLQFSGAMLDAFRILTRAMEKKGSENLIKHGLFAQTYAEGAANLKKAPDLNATDFEAALANDIAKKLDDITEGDATGDLEKPMKNIIDICSKYLAQVAEFNKEKGEAFKYLLEKMRERPKDILTTKGKVPKTMGAGAQELQDAPGLYADSDDPIITEEILKKLEERTKETPQNLKDEMPGTLDLASKYLSQKIVTDSERGPAFDKLIELLKKNGSEPFAPGYPSLGAAYEAAHVLNTAPGFRSIKPDPATAPMFAATLHNFVDWGTPQNMKQDMAELIPRCADYLSGFARDRAKAQEILVKMMNENKGTEIARRNNVPMTYGLGVKEFENNPVMVPLLPMKCANKEITDKMASDTANLTPEELKGAMKGITKDAGGGLSQDVALMSGVAGERYPRQLVAAAADTQGDKQLFKHGHYDMSHAEASEHIKNAGELDADHKNHPLSHEIAKNLQQTVNATVTPGTSQRLEPTVHEVAAHLAKVGQDKNAAMKHLVEKMKLRGDDHLAHIDGTPHSYHQAATKIENATSLRNDLVDQTTYGTVKPKLDSLMEEHHAPEHRHVMPGLVDNVSKFLSNLGGGFGSKGAGGVGPGGMGASAIGGGVGGAGGVGGGPGGVGGGPGGVGGGPGGVGGGPGGVGGGPGGVGGGPGGVGGGPGGVGGGPGGVGGGPGGVGGGPGGVGGGPGGVGGGPGGVGGGPGGVGGGPGGVGGGSGGVGGGPGGVGGGPGGVGGGPGGVGGGPGGVGGGPGGVGGGPGGVGGGPGGVGGGPGGVGGGPGGVGGGPGGVGGGPGGAGGGPGGVGGGPGGVGGGPGGVGGGPGGVGGGPGGVGGGPGGVGGGPGGVGGGPGGVGGGPGGVGWGPGGTGAGPGGAGAGPGGAGAGPGGAGAGPGGVGGGPGGAGAGPGGVGGGPGGVGAGPGGAEGGPGGTGSGPGGAGWGPGGAGGGVGGAGGRRGAGESGTDADRARREAASGGRSEKDYDDANNHLISELKRKGNDNFHKQGQIEMTNREAADILEKDPRSKAEKAISDAPETDKLSKKFERKLSTVVEGSTPSNLKDAMTDVIIDSARPLAEHVTGQAFEAAVKEALVDGMQRKDKDSLVEEGGEAESFYYGAQRLKKGKVPSTKDSDPKLSRELAKKMDDCMRSRGLPRKLMGTSKDQTKTAADYLAKHVLDQDPEIEALIDLLTEMEVKGDQNIVKDPVSMTNKDAAEYLKFLTSYEDKIGRPDSKLNGQIRSEMKALMAKVPLDVYTSAVRDKVIGQQAGLLTSYVKVLVEKTEALKLLIARMEETPHAIILRHATAHIPFSEATEKLYGKTMEEIINVKNSDPVVARKLQIKLTNAMGPDVEKPNMKMVVDEVANYLAVQLLQPKVIKVCTCMKSVFTQCELWNEEVLRRIARPYCTCDPSRPGSREPTGAQWTMKECPAMASRSQDGPGLPCPANQPCRDVYMAKAEPRYTPLPYLNPTRLPPEPTGNMSIGADLANRFTMMGQLSPNYSSEHYYSSPTTSSHVADPESLHQQQTMNQTMKMLKKQYSSTASPSSPSPSPSPIRCRSTMLAATVSQDYQPRFSASNPSSTVRSRRTGMSAKPSVVTTDQMSDLYAMMVSLMWNMIAWRNWLQGIFDRALSSSDLDPNIPSDKAFAKWMTFQKAVDREAMQWRQYIKFSQQLALRLESRYKNKEIVSPTLVRIKTRDYMECQEEMLEIIDMFNKWTRWLRAVLKETESLQQISNKDVPLHVLCWTHLKKKVQSSICYWTKYTTHLDVCWKNKYTVIMSAWEQEGPIWVMSAYGAVPSGAVGAGQYSDEVIWVARTTHNSEVLPGALLPSKHCCLIYAGGAAHVYTKYQVLCMPLAHWIPWRVGLNTKTQAFAVCAAPGVHVGRVEYHTHYLVGPVAAPDYLCYVLIHGRPYYFDSYELLVVFPEGEGSKSAQCSSHT